MKSFLFLLSALCALWTVDAFAPSPSASRSVTFKTARRVSGMKPIHVKRTILHMSEEKPTGEATESEAAAAPAKGEAFYDDEYDSAPQKAGISDSMKQRLLAEASTGLDSEEKQTNVLLYIMVGVGALVLLGGQGILY